MGQYVNFLSRLINVTLASNRTGSGGAKAFWLKQLEKLVNRYTSMNCNRFRYPRFCAECLREKRDLFEYIIDFAKVLGALAEHSGYFMVRLSSRAVCFSKEGEVVSCGQA
jgi:hypothetical protein